MLTEPDSNAHQPTRHTLLSRLRNCEDQPGWREFFDTYWRLIYTVARKAGLGEVEAEDVVQNTFIYLTRKMPRFRYDRARGSFRSWLRVVTRSRINVYLRQERSRDVLIREPLPVAESEGVEESLEIPDPAGDALDELWQREWEENLLNTAMRRLRSKVSSQQLLIFRLATINQLPLTQVANRLGVSLAQVYLARHRIGKMLKAEVLRLRRETE